MRRASTVPVVSAKGPTQVDDVADRVLGVLDEGGVHGLLDDHVRRRVVGLGPELHHDPAQVVVAHDQDHLAEQHQEDVEREQLHLLPRRDRQVLDLEDLLDAEAGAVAQRRDDQDAEDLQTEVPLEAVEDHAQVERLRRRAPRPLALVLHQVEVDFVRVVRVALVGLQPVHHVEVDPARQVAVGHDRPHPAEEPPVQEAVRRRLLSRFQPLLQPLDLLGLLFGLLLGLLVDRSRCRCDVLFVSLHEIFITMFRES